jgi:RecJ-like exonuclease
MSRQELIIEIDDEKIPAKYEVCPRCKGHGMHTNPSVDGNGITQSEMDELGEQFREDYINGLYDVTCYECKGKRVVKVIDQEFASDEQIKLYDEMIEDLRIEREILRMEQKYQA